MVSLPWYVLVLITALLVAITNIIKKHVLNHEHALEMMAAESPFRLIALIALAPFITVPAGIAWVTILLSAGLLFFAQLYRNKSYRHLPISTVSPLMNLSPIFLLVIATLILGERLSAVQLAGVFLLMIGGYFLDLKNKNLLGPLKHASKSPYTATVVVTLILLSLLGTVDKINLQTIGVPPLTYLFWVYLIYVTLTLVVQSYRFGHQEIIDDLKRGGKWLFLTGMLSMAELIILFHALAIPGVLIALVVPLRRSATLIETAVGGKVFGEKRLAQKIAAALVMIVGVVLIV